MSLIAIVLALLIEQVRPLRVDKWLTGPLARIAGWFEDRFNDGRAGSGRIAWLLMVVALVGLTWLADRLLGQLHPVLAFAFSLLVLYLTMGVRHQSHFFTDIHVALRLGDLDRARDLLGQWRGTSCGDADEAEVVRLAIEQSLIAAHRNVYAVIFWFLILPGPTGAVLYRVASYLEERWGRCESAEFGGFGEPANQFFNWIDWLPVRVTAFSFSVVGNFEDALLCWRTQAEQWRGASSGILLSSGGGALGVRLGLPCKETGRTVDRPEMGCGEDARVEFMQGTVGLIWRALCLCLLVLVLLRIAGWVAS